MPGFLVGACGGASVGGLVWVCGWGLGVCVCVIVIGIVFVRFCVCKCVCLCVCTLSWVGLQREINAFDTHPRGLDKFQEAKHSPVWPPLAQDCTCLGI